LDLLGENFISTPVAVDADLARSFTSGIFRERDPSAADFAAGLLPLRTND